MILTLSAILGTIYLKDSEKQYDSQKNIYGSAKEYKH
jgi:hypothetical protein